MFLSRLCLSSITLRQSGTVCAYNGASISTSQAVFRSNAAQVREGTAVCRKQAVGLGECAVQVRRLRRSMAILGVHE